MTQNGYNVEKKFRAMSEAVGQKFKTMSKAVGQKFKAMPEAVREKFKRMSEAVGRQTTPERQTTLEDKMEEELEVERVRARVVVQQTT